MSALERLEELVRNCNANGFLPAELKRPPRDREDRFADVTDSQGDYEAIKTSKRGGDK